VKVRLAAKIVSTSRDVSIPQTYFLTYLIQNLFSPLQLHRTSYLTVECRQSRLVACTAESFNATVLTPLNIQY